MAELVIDEVWAEGSTVRSSISAPPACRQFFTDEDFFVEYDVDLAGVPEALLAVPVLAQVAPVAWAVGADVRVPVVDRRFLDSLGTVEGVLREMYPTFVSGGTVAADDVAGPTEAPRDPASVGMLFTGGVDSLATYVRHRDEDPVLVNVQGWVVGIDERDQWEHTKRRIEAYGRRFGVDARFVRSNMLSFLDRTRLTVEFDHLHDGGWYSAVGGGLGLLGLCAPMTAALDMGRLYIAATHWEGFPAPPVVDHWDGAAMPWGSHPDIDDSVAWGSTTLVHDGFDLTRQERIGVIADYIEAVDDGLPVRSCADSATAGNCSSCEKCLRTALGLALEGVDPNRHGFELDRAAFSEALARIRAGDWLDDDHHAVYWEELRRRAAARSDYPVDGASEFVGGLRAVDFDEVAGSSTRERLVLSAARAVPEVVFSPLYRAYLALRGTAGGSSREAPAVGGDPAVPAESRTDGT